jgi:hypothetical protein
MCASECIKKEATNTINADLSHITQINTNALMNFNILLISSMITKFLIQKKIQKEDPTLIKPLTHTSTAARKEVTVIRKKLTYC